MPIQPRSPGDGHPAAAEPWLEQLAWELTRAELERRSRRWYDQLPRLLSSTGRHAATDALRAGPALGSLLTRDRRVRRLAAIQFALSDVVAGFDSEERRRLRAEHILPAGFIDAVLERAKSVEVDR